MKPRNVIISLLCVVALLVFIFFKIKKEPKKKPTFNRNVSKVEYSRTAQCLMECQGISANDVTYILRNGEVLTKSLDPEKHPCPSFVLKGKTQNGQALTVFLTQCGRATKISRCFKIDNQQSCDCENEKLLSLLYLKRKD